MKVRIHDEQSNGLSIMLFGFHTVYASLFLALGKGLEGGGPNGILYAQPIADVLATAITALMAIPLHRRLNAA